MSNERHDDELTALLNEWGRIADVGDDDDDGDATPGVAPSPDLESLYERCRLIVRRVKRRASSLRGLDTTDLLHRAWERTLLVKGDLAPERRWASRQHFFASLARATIESIIDEARYRRALKRGGGAPSASLGPGFEPDSDRRRAREDSTLDEETRVALRQALDEFATVDPRACTVVAMRQFWGFSAAEIAASFDVTERTVNRDWRAARAWLARRVNQILGLPVEPDRDGGDGLVGDANP